MPRFASCFGVILVLLVTQAADAQLDPERVLTEARAAELRGMTPARLSVLEGTNYARNNDAIEDQPYRRYDPLFPRSYCALDF